MISFKEDGQYLIITFKNRDIIRHSRQHSFLSLGSADGDIRRQHGNFTIREKNLNRESLSDWKILEESTGKISFRFDDKVNVHFEVVDTRLHIFFSDYASGLNRLWLELPAQAQEHIYGCGEQYTHLDLRGRKVPLWVQEQGIGRGRDIMTLLANVHSGSGGNWHTTYFSQLSFVSSANYFCHFDSYAYAEFDFRSKKKHTLHVWAIPERIVLDVADQATDVLGSLSAYLGRQPKLPDWTYDGVWLGVQGGLAKAQEKLQSALDAKVKVSALWAQDWEGKRLTSFGYQLMWDWKYDAELYQDLPEQIKKLNAQGVRFMGYINPFLAIGTTDAEDSPIPPEFLYKQAREKGYCAKKADGSDYYVKITTFPAAMVDLTNPEAFAWIKSVIKKNMIDIGLHGWMADFGEYLPIDAVMHAGQDMALIHNQYPVLWAKANREAIEESGKLGECVFFSRAGHNGSSRYATAIWAGDQMVNWSMDDGLATVIPAGLSLGFCGIGQYHSDIGGYTTLLWYKRSKELFMRWSEQSVFTPIMRTHEGNRPGANWQFNSDPETLEHFARMSQIFTLLRNYHLHVQEEYCQLGLPPMRHPYIHYETDENLHKIRYQYLYGRDLYIAPVVHKGKTSIDCTLPDDKWVHVWTGQTFQGGNISIGAPLGKPAVFYRSRSAFTGLFEQIATI